MPLLLSVDAETGHKHYTIRSKCYQMHNKLTSEARVKMASFFESTEDEIGKTNILVTGQTKSTFLTGKKLCHSALCASYYFRFYESCPMPNMLLLYGCKMQIIGVGLLGRYKVKGKEKDGQ